ncbi:hypothetical protein CYY_007853 [Polysphondylium violaceum]|uniref:MRH domain-containing protein n=1 Tax=Polysphondylium violaceum TaxID=133409 RepID=A0A8J4V4K4_9MYCE|nr:hypothetical protein CYY_007853 [Polysphondylium violaceum]
MYRFLFVCIITASLIKINESSSSSSNNSSTSSGDISHFITSSCNFTINDNIYDLSPLVLTDGRSYRSNFSFLKFDFIFNICAYTSDCNNKYSNRGNSQSCSLFPLAVQVGDPQTEKVQENQNGITLSYTGSNFMCSRSNELIFTCDKSTNMKITSISAHRCKYTVNIHSKYACPTKTSPPLPPPPPPPPKLSECVFQGSGGKDSFIDFSTLKSKVHQTSIGFISDGHYDYYNLYFSVCGSINICSQYTQSSPSENYQSCQVYSNTNISIQTGDLRHATHRLTPNGIILQYQASKMYLDCQRNISLVLSCNNDYNFKIGQARETSACGYEIPVQSTHACQFHYDGSTSGSTSSNSDSISPSSSSSEEEPNVKCVINSSSKSIYGFDLSSMALSNSLYYTVPFKNSPLNEFTLLFSICNGKVEKCQQYNQLSGISTSYQSCQVYTGQYSIQTGTPALFSYEATALGISFIYKANMYSNSIARQNRINIICNSSVGFDIVSANVQESTYQVNINSKYGCPKQCIFTNSTTGASMDFSRLILPNNGAYKAQFQGFILYFSICGQADICKTFQNSQSCQIIEGNRTIQTGLVTKLETTVTFNRAILSYVSNTDPCREGFRRNILQLDCNPSQEFKIDSANEDVQCVYYINIQTKYACYREFIYE